MSTSRSSKAEKASGNKREMGNILPNQHAAKKTIRLVRKKGLWARADMDPDLMVSTAKADWERHDGLVLHVLSFFDVSEVMLTKTVNKRWNRLCNTAIDNNFQPKREFHVIRELNRIVRKYCQYNKATINHIGRTYGFPIGKWKVGKVTKFSYLFAFQRHFNEDISKWDVSNARCMLSMFMGATSFNQPLHAWNVGNVVVMDLMFAQASSFNQSVEAWDTSKVVSMKQMFESARSFNKPIAGWDMSSLSNDDYGLARGADGYYGIFCSAAAFRQEFPEDWDRSSVFGDSSR
ncbi:MAG: hypothetical protein SGILL_006924 [Bacillariaceae sp.]